MQYKKSFIFYKKYLLILLASVTLLYFIYTYVYDTKSKIDIPKIKKGQGFIPGL